VTASAIASETKRPTSDEAADRAGVSHQTVSGYLRNKEGLKPPDHGSVPARVEALNYRPKQIARSMRTRPNRAHRPRAADNPVAAPTTARCSARRSAIRVRRPAASSPADEECLLGR
jgi:hypothetical protein